jgi:hypothetical protein
MLVNKYDVILILCIETREIQACSQERNTPLGVVGLSRSTVILLCNRKVPSSILGAETTLFFAGASYRYVSQIYVFVPFDESSSSRRTNS